MPHEQLKSARSSTRAFARFINGTTRSIDIIWVNFTGAFVKYKTLLPTQFVDVVTFTGHAWIFLDSKTHDKMCVDGEEIFYAAPLQSLQNRHRLALICGTIHLPLYSLKKCALLRVRDLLRAPDSVSLLELPAILKKDLQYAFEGQNVEIIPLSRQ